MKSGAGNIKVYGWERTDDDALKQGQYAYVRLPYKSIDDLISNGRRNIAVIEAHLDDDVIGLGGTLALLSYSMKFGTNKNITPLRHRGLMQYNKKQAIDVQKRLLEEGIYLDLLYEEPSNIIVVYVTNGAKSAESFKKGMELAHIDKKIEEILEERGLDSIEELAGLLNTRRYFEQISSLHQIGGDAAYFFEYPTGPIKAGDKKVAQDISTVLKKLQPHRVYTHSPFEATHDTHRKIQNLTVIGLRSALPYLEKIPEFKGHFVWDPLNLKGLEVVDTSASAHLKKLAVHQHSLFGSQGKPGIGRKYEKILNLDLALALKIRYKLSILKSSVDEFTASFQRPNLPVDITHAEGVINMQDFLTNPNLSQYEFVKQQLHKTYLKGLDK